MKRAALAAMMCLCAGAALAEGGRAGAAPESGSSTSAYARLVAAQIRQLVPAGAHSAPGWANVEFHIGPSGRVVDYSITRSSGHAGLEAAVPKLMQALHAPPPPDGGFHGSQLIRVLGARHPPAAGDHSAYGAIIGMALRRLVVRTNHYSAGTVTADITIGPNGRIVASDVRSANPELVAVTRRILARLDAPAPPGGGSFRSRQVITFDP